MSAARTPRSQPSGGRAGTPGQPSRPAGATQVRTMAGMLPELGPVIQRNPEPISSEVTRRLLDYLISGQVKPGERLPSERQLAETLGVGRSHVRQAIKSLTVLGLVDARQGDGTYLKRTDSPLLPAGHRVGPAAGGQALAGPRRGPRGAGDPAGRPGRRAPRRGVAGGDAPLRGGHAGDDGQRRVRACRRRLPPGDRALDGQPVAVSDHEVHPEPHAGLDPARRLRTRDAAGHLGRARRGLRGHRGRAIRALRGAPWWATWRAPRGACRPPSRTRRSDARRPRTRRSVPQGAAS